MATRNHIGKTVYISAALPATNDKAGFEALNWTQVKGVQQLPQLGFQHATIDVDDLTSGITTGVKGMGSGVDTSMAFRNVDSDTGQALAKTTADSATGVCSVKIGTGSGAAGALVASDPVQYAQGFLHSYAENQGDGSTFEGFTVGFRQNAVTVDDVEPT